LKGHPKGADAALQLRQQFHCQNTSIHIFVVQYIPRRTPPKSCIIPPTYRNVLEQLQMVVQAYELEIFKVLGYPDNLNLVHSNISYICKKNLMMTKGQHIEYWVNTAQKDWIATENLFHTKYTASVPENSHTNNWKK
jgi:hypothetical protein